MSVKFTAIIGKLFGNDPKQINIRVEMVQIELLVLIFDDLIL